MIDFTAWAWPQYVMATLLMIGLLREARKHGEREVNTRNVFWHLVAAAIWSTLLYFGGFWS